MLVVFVFRCPFIFCVFRSGVLFYSFSLSCFELRLVGPFAAVWWRRMFCSGMMGPLIRDRLIDFSVGYGLWVAFRPFPVRCFGSSSCVSFVEFWMFAVVAVCGLDGCMFFGCLRSFLVQPFA